MPFSLDETSESLGLPKTDLLNEPGEPVAAAIGGFTLEETQASLGRVRAPRAPVSTVEPEGEVSLELPPATTSEITRSQTDVFRLQRQVAENQRRAYKLYLLADQEPEAADVVARMVALGELNKDTLFSLDPSGHRFAAVMRRVAEKEEQQRDNSPLGLIGRAFDQLTGALGSQFYEVIEDPVGQLAGGPVLAGWRTFAGKGPVPGPGGRLWIPDEPQGLLDWIPFGRMGGNFLTRLTGFREPRDADQGLRALGHSKLADGISSSNLSLLLSDSAGDVVRDLGDEFPERWAGAVASSQVPLSTEEADAVASWAQVASTHPESERKALVLTDMLRQEGFLRFLLSPAISTLTVAGAIDNTLAELDATNTGLGLVLGTLLGRRASGARVTTGGQGALAPVLGQEGRGWIPLPPSQTGRQDLQQPAVQAALEQQMVGIRAKAHAYVLGNTRQWQQRRDRAALEVMAFVHPGTWIPFSKSSTAGQQATKQVRGFLTSYLKSQKVAPARATAAAESMAAYATRSVYRDGSELGYDATREALGHVVSGVTGQPQQRELAKLAFDRDVGTAFGVAGPEPLPGIEFPSATFLARRHPIRATQKFFEKVGFKQAQSILDDKANEQTARALALSLNETTSRPVVMDRLVQWMQDQIDYWQNPGAAIEHYYRAFGGLFFDQAVLDRDPISRSARLLIQSMRNRQRVGRFHAIETPERYMELTEEALHRKMTPDEIRTILHTIETPRQYADEVAPKVREIVLPKVASDLLTDTEKQLIDEVIANRAAWQISTDALDEQFRRGSKVWNHIKEQLLMIDPTGDGRTLELRLRRRALLEQAERRRMGRKAALEKEAVTRASDRLAGATEVFGEYATRLGSGKLELLERYRAAETAADASLSLISEAGEAVRTGRPITVTPQLVSMLEAIEKGAGRKSPTIRALVKRLRAQLHHDKMTLLNRRPTPTADAAEILHAATDLYRILSKALRDILHVRIPSAELEKLQDLSGIFGESYLRRIRQVNDLRIKTNLAWGKLWSKYDELYQAQADVRIANLISTDQEFSRFAQEVEDALGEMSDNDFREVGDFLNVLVNRHPDRRIWDLGDPASDAARGRPAPFEPVPPREPTRPPVPAPLQPVSPALAEPEGAPLGLRPGRGPVLTPERITELIQTFDPRVKLTNEALDQLTQTLRAEFAWGLRRLAEEGYSVHEIPAWAPHVIQRKDLIFQMSPFPGASGGPDPTKHRYWKFIQTLRDLGLGPVEDFRYAYAVWRATVENMLAWSHFEKQVVSRFGRKLKRRVAVVPGLETEGRRLAAVRPGQPIVETRGRMGQEGEVLGAIRGAEQIYAFHGDVYAIPMQVHNALERMQGGFRSQGSGLNGIVKVWQWFTQLWKGFATVPLPRFHERNITASMYNAWLGGVEDPNVYFDAFKILNIPGSVRSMRGEAIPAPPNKLGSLEGKRWAQESFQLPDGTQKTLGEFRDELDEIGVLQRDIYSVDMEHDPHLEMRLKFGGQLRQNKVANLMMEANPFSRQFVALKVGRDVGRHIEDWLRSAAYLDGRINKGMGVQESLAYVVRIHFDYADLTPALRFLRDHIHPFSTWIRKNLAFQLESLVKRPMKLYRTHVLLEHQNTLGSDDEVDQVWMPEYHRQRWGLQYQSEDQTTPHIQLYALNLPVEDLNVLSFVIPEERTGITRTVQIVDELINRSYPLYQWPFQEIMRGFSGRGYDFFRKTPDMDRRVVAPAIIKDWMDVLPSWKNEQGEWEGFRGWTGLREEDVVVHPTHPDPDQRVQRLWRINESALRALANWGPAYYAGQVPYNVEWTEMMFGDLMDLPPRERAQRMRLMGAMAPVKGFRYDPVYFKRLLMEQINEEEKAIQGRYREVAPTALTGREPPP